VGLIEPIPKAVVSSWTRLEGKVCSRVDSGLINETFLVGERGHREAVLQRLHPVFDETVNLDIDAVTRWLSRKGLATPRIIPTDDGSLYCLHENHVWRALTFIDGRSRQTVENPEVAFEAGALVGRFHSALGDFEHDYHFSRGNVHDTARHLQALRAARDGHRSHSLYDRVAPLADRMLRGGDSLHDFSALPKRHVHGDLKFSNVLYDESDHAVCLIDLDTVCRMAWPLEMGDALRSWCNPRKEDRRPASLDLELLDAALAGYASRQPDYLGRDEKQAVVPGLIQICLELAVRFLTDALEESYFAWNPDRYASRGAHNLARAQAMLELHEDVLSKRHETELIVRDRVGAA